MADALQVRRRRRISVPLLSSALSARLVGLISPVDASITRPLVEGLGTDTTVTDPSGMALFGITPVSFPQALADAIREAATHEPPR